MFSRFKKPDDTAARPVAAPAKAPAQSAGSVARRPMSGNPATQPSPQAATAEKEKKRKERMGEIKAD